MGFQKLHDTSGMEQNTKAHNSAKQRTTTVSAKSQDTTKAQYERLSKTGKKEGE